MYPFSKKHSPDIINPQGPTVQGAVELNAGAETLMMLPVLQSAEACAEAVQKARSKRDDAKVSEKALASLKLSHKEQIKDAEREIANFLQDAEEQDLIAVGYHALEQVTVEVRIDYNKQTVHYCRSDTGQEVEPSRTLTRDEIQARMDETEIPTDPGKVAMVLEALPGDAEHLTMNSSELTLMSVDEIRSILARCHREGWTIQGSHGEWEVTGDGEIYLEEHATKEAEQLETDYPSEEKPQLSIVPALTSEIRAEEEMYMLLCILSHCPKGKATCERIAKREDIDMTVDEIRSQFIAAKDRGLVTGLKGERKSWTITDKGRGHIGAG